MLRNLSSLEKKINKYNSQIKYIQYYTHWKAYFKCYKPTKYFVWLIPFKDENSEKNLKCEREEAIQGPSFEVSLNEGTLDGCEKE